MWSLERAQRELEPYFKQATDNIDLYSMKEHLSKICYEEVFNIIVEHTRADKNIVGPIFVEDFKTCREADFKFESLLSELKHEADENCDYEVIISGDCFCMGTLLLRTPFPSGVLIRQDEKPILGFIEVKDTKKALGFHKTLIFSYTDSEIRKLPPNPQQYDYFLPGFFYLPVKETNNPMWYKLIPNTIGMREGSMMVMPGGLEPIRFNLKPKETIIS